MESKQRASWERKIRRRINELCQQQHRYKEGSKTDYTQVLEERGATPNNTLTNMESNTGNRYKGYRRISLPDLKVRTGMENLMFEVEEVEAEE